MSATGTRNGMSRARVVEALITRYVNKRLQHVTAYWHQERRAYTVQYVQRGKLYQDSILPTRARSLIRKRVRT